MATCAALVPYYPNMPIPTCAYNIILTSFAPSPIANVSLPNFLTILTIYAFWFGVTLQNTAESDMLIIYSNYY